MFLPSRYKCVVILVSLVLLGGAIAALLTPWSSQAIVSNCRRNDATCEAQNKMKAELAKKSERLLAEFKQKVDALLLDAERNTSEVKTDVLEAFTSYKQDLGRLYEEQKRTFFSTQKGAGVINQSSFAQLLDADYQDKIRWADFAIKLAIEADAEEKKTHRIVTKFRQINQQFRAMSDLVGNIREELDRLNSKLPCTSKLCI